MTDDLGRDERAVRLGTVFRAYRKRRKITLREMSSLMDLSINTIRLHEAGTRLLRLPEIWNAAAILRVKPKALLNTEIQKERANAE